MPLFQRKPDNTKIAQQVSEALKNAYKAFHDKTKNADLRTMMLEGQQLDGNFYTILSPIPLQVLEDQAFRDQIYKTDYLDAEDQILFGQSLEKALTALRIQKRMR